MTKPSIDQILKLPRWAQDHIATLQRERDCAIRDLNKWCDESTPAPIFIEEYCSTGESQGLTVKRRNIHTHRLSIEWEGVWLDVLLASKDGQRDTGINLQWGGGQRLVHSEMACFVPRGYQAAAIISKANMR